MLVPAALSAALLLGRAAALLGFDAAFLGALGGTRLFADLRFHQGRANQCFQPPECRTAILRLAARSSGLEQYAAVVDELLAGEPAQPIPGRYRQAGILR